ncbi:MAG: carboxypeptidase-like regulatory domain-containing protein [Mongoliibacter sp.]|uniref:carboxypeptidase-like regulatory domain-containing protein n=1 Tax=Mongoliibacter sp. TaxID=2022438 RepID=UPI0012F05500|nr:carboxypeptidase-like regulatory domain-containing protein [Mongoliibacter sp.]TVP53332.1 MAG: carboxypeptidase-like regulatory domain-containing protein [Mongoliibacter sp.]
MRKSFILILLFSIIWRAEAQHLVKGQVKDAQSKEPLEYATVFISNSTFGAITDNRGQFEIEIPKGQFELVVNFMGYGSKTLAVDTENLKSEYLFELQPIPIDLKERMVEAKRDKDWYKNLKIFERFFLGESINAKKTKILNPEVLILDDQSKPGSLIAIAKAPLEIENPNLGYKLTFVLTDFECVVKEKTWSYFGYPYFEEMDLPLRRMKKVEKNRNRAFNGSLTHLIRAMYKGDLEESGFELYPVVHKRLPNNTYQEVLGEEALTLEQVLFSTEGAGKFYTFRKPVFVLYLNESEESSYKLQFQPASALSYTQGASQRKIFHQTSKLILRGRQIRIFENGGYFNPKFLYVEGYMAWERVADMMPIDY